MKKLLYLFITLCLAFLVTGCSNKKVTYRFFNVYDTNYFDSSKTISDITLKGVPSKPIAVGYFSYSGIYLQIDYIDGTKEKVDVTERFFPEEVINDFKIPGKKNYDLVYKDKHMSLKFELVEASQPIQYQVNFYDKDGKIIYTTYCSYLDSVTCPRENEIKNYTDGKNIYIFKGQWSENLDHVYYNLDVTPVYEKYAYTNASDNYYTSQNLYKRADISEGSTCHQLIGIGRINNVLLASLETIQVTEQKNQTLTFDKKKNYGNSAALVEAMAENIKNNVIKQNYIHDNSPYSMDIKLVNSGKLNFNANLNSAMDAYIEDGLTDSINIPSCITTSFANYTGFSGYTREDGYAVSSKNVLDTTNAEFFVTEYIGSGENASKVIKPITPDYKLGYYRVDFVCDLDVFIDFTYHVESTGGYGRNYIIDDAKIGFTYSKGGSQFVLRYSEDGNFESYGMPITITDYKTLLTLAMQ